MNFIKSMFSDGTNISSTRSVMIAVCAIVLLKNVAFNVSALVHGGAQISFDPSDIGLLLTVIGGKVLQSNIEKNQN